MSQPWWSNSSEPEHIQKAHHVMSNRTYFFTSESVSMGHPDKLADQISDAILDGMLAVDPNCRVACETMVSTGMAVIAGEVTCDGYVEISDIVRKVALDIGYDDASKGLDGKSCAVLVLRCPGFKGGSRSSNTQDISIICSSMSLDSNSQLTAPLEYKVFGDRERESITGGVFSIII